ncbi:metallophosphoesterase [Paenibacillus sp. TRM 82003]|nr:metallophosphoesterase [Paenibacillus sp. TRM 82003]
MSEARLRIGVVSDTHMFSRGQKLPKALTDGLAGVDLILHAGDFTDPAVASLFEAIAPLEAVAGNNDGAAMIERYGFRKTIEVGGRRIGLVHGHDGPGRSTEWKALHAFRDEAVDIVVFGHSHIPHYETIDGVLLFNPGSPTDKRWQPRFSYGIIELGDRIEAAHRYYDDKS